ncbi:hypothetical protein AB6A40_009062 [Gnathostoma spinigerum]|uniref:Uncharacterized protein n=1 Tax=Gnathostoma spinigerum TaxID=75299 RepID=A0ABD6ER85_9BILA
MERSSKYHHPQKKRKSDIRRVRDRICKIATKFAVMGFEKKSKPHLEKVKKKELYKECSETAGKLLKPSPIDLSNYVPLDDADFGCSSSFNVLAEIVKTAAHSEPVIELNESNVADASDKSKSRNEFDDFIPLVNIDSRSSTTGLTDSEVTFFMFCSVIVENLQYLLTSNFRGDNGWKDGQLYSNCLIFL